MDEYLNSFDIDDKVIYIILCKVSTTNIDLLKYLYAKSLDIIKDIDDIKDVGRCVEIVIADFVKRHKKIDVAKRIGIWW